MVRAYARLKPGVTMAEAHAQIEQTLESWRRASPPMFRKEMRLGLISVREEQVGSIQLALLVSPSGMVETPRLQAKHGLV